MPIYLNQSTGNTSGISNFVQNRDTIVRRALRIVGAFPSTDLPRPEQLRDAVSVLNMMLKTWSMQGFLWLREFKTVTLVAGQNSYLLGPDSDTPMNRPVFVYNVNKKNSSGNEIPMVSLNRSEWMQIPNKTSQSTPVQFYYDPQTINGILYVWPVPQTGTTDTLILDVDRQLDIMADSLNDFDFPPHWMETITINLAARLAPEYGVPLSERMQLEKEASGALLISTTNDRDIASIHFGVNRQ